MNCIDITNATPEQLDYLSRLTCFGITDINTLSTMTLLPITPEEDDEPINYGPSYDDCFPDPWADDYAAIVAGEL
jgi:hypothetical protein